MFFKTALLIVPVAATTVFAVAYPAPVVTPAPAVRAEPRNIIDDATSAIGNEINSIKDGINSAAHWGTSVLDNGKTIIKDDAGQVLTLADNEASTLVTLGGAVYTVASTSYASETDKIKAQESSMSASASATGSNGSASAASATPDSNGLGSNAAPTLSPLAAPLLAASFGLIYGMRMLF